MATDQLEQRVLEQAEYWQSSDFDEATRNEVKRMMDENPELLSECFYTDLEFGTGGMRGIMGVGTNRVNKYTIGMATQGLFNYLKQTYPEGKIRLAIAYDSRNNSPEFAGFAAEVLATNGAEVFLFNELRPTPELSFAIRQLGCQSGIVITASHNPKEYNGYKVYWDDGAQIIAPHDKGIIEEVRKIKSFSQVKLGNAEGRVRMIGKNVDEAYLDKLNFVSLSKGLEEYKSKLGIAYTSLHGTGITLVPRALRQMGFSKLHVVSPQDKPNGDFPTAESPNPEEREALTMAIDQAKANDCEIVLGTDPDCDRVGVAVKDGDSFRLLNGNETFSLLAWYHLNRWKEQGNLKGKEFIAKTVVTSDIISRMAEDFGVNCYETLTGFKFIAGVIREKEAEENFIMGGEESYGYLSRDFVRDKDGVISSVMIAETAAWAHSRGMDLLQLLKEIHEKYGLFRESLISVKKEGRAGKEEIAAMMEGFRNDPPQSLGAVKVVEIKDIQEGVIKSTDGKVLSKLDLPQSNVIQFLLEDGSKVSARPSGTEPKIKFYFSVRKELAPGDDYPAEAAKLDERVKQIQSELGLI